MPAWSRPSWVNAGLVSWADSKDPSVLLGVRWADSKDPSVLLPWKASPRAPWHAHGGHTFMLGLRCLPVLGACFSSLAVAQAPDVPPSIAGFVSGTVARL